MKRPVPALPLAVALLALAACERRRPGEGPAAAPAATPAEAAVGGRIVVGHVASLTGAEAAFGASTERGIRLALDEVNAKGGVKGRPIALETYDDQGKPEEASAAATRLADHERVSVLLGEVVSARSLAVAAVAERAQVPMITPTSTSPRVTVDGGRVRPFVFRVCFVDAFQGAAMARHARGALGLARVAVLRDSASEYSAGLADAFLSRFRELGGTVVDDLSYREGDADYRPQLLAIRAKAPQAIYVPGYYADVARLARQARDLGMRQVLLGGDGWDSARLLELAGAALEGAAYTTHYSPDDPSPRVRDFIERFEARFGVVPDGFAATGYDAARVAADAMTRARDLSRSAIRDALAATRDYPGVTGIISIDARHDAVKPAVVLRIQGGAARYAATVSPDGRETAAR